MEESIHAFGNRLKSKKVGLFYFAGHYLDINETAFNRFIIHHFYVNNGIRTQEALERNSWATF